MWCIAALGRHCKASDWPKHCSAAIAVRYDCFYQRRVPTTVVQCVAELAKGTNGAAQRHAAAASACLLVASALQAASPADLVPEPPHASRGMRRRLATRCRGPFNGGMPHQELALNKHTQACAAIKPPKPPSEEELRVRLSRRSGAKHVQRAAAGVAAAYKPTSSAIRHSARCAPSRWPSP